MVQPGQEIESTVLRVGGKEAGTGGGWWVRFWWVLCGAVRQWEETLPGAGFGHRRLWAVDQRRNRNHSVAENAFVAEGKWHRK